MYVIHLMSERNCERHVTNERNEEAEAVST